MSKWLIDKQFSFCYGHRVWSQHLKTEYCAEGDTETKCRHLHGHEGLAHVFLESDTLERGMVTDFKHLGWLKDFIDKHLDHKFIIDYNDPMFNAMVEKPYEELTGHSLRFIPEVSRGYNCDMFKGESLPVMLSALDLTSIKDPAVINSPEYEVLQGFTVVYFVPTSENLSKWLYHVVDQKMSQIGVETAQIDWFETPKSRASYRNGS